MKTDTEKYIFGWTILSEEKKSDCFVMATLKNPRTLSSKKKNQIKLGLINS